MDMRTAHETLTAKDTAKLQSYAARIKWGFSLKSLKRQIEKFRKGTEHDKAEVLFLLEDCNFHDAAAYLCDGDVEGAVKWAEANLAF